MEATSRHDQSDRLGCKSPTIKFKSDKQFLFGSSLLQELRNFTAGFHTDLAYFLEKVCSALTKHNMGGIINGRLNSAI